ncbi:MAG: DUF4153 domain-containing protein [Alphaproteobacteria bacterium]|nr:DUF4153 domain-containing protein [Alphaproteobacteria bacterium]MBV9370972.1 DUF4153 domain-containing protein [Alphaproteobacteria bacterium]MBV9899515.1 DUF4153 domain-containing protein [Alphaproteobacteria bacterium]
MTDAGEPLDHPAWPERIWILTALGAALGLAFHLLTRGAGSWGWTEDPARLAGASFVAVGGLAFAFSLERRRWPWAVAFAATAGLVVAGVTAWNGPPENWADDEAWHFFASLFAVAVAVPLFQGLRDEGRLRAPAAAVHAHAWSNLILWGAACAFVLSTFLLALLLAALFGLIGITFPETLLNRRWFDVMLVAAALGAAVGILRDRDKVLGALQRVVRAVLSFLAPVLALGLVLFVAALPFTGLEPLWRETKATTPILLLCILGAVFLANAAIGNGPEEEPKLRPLRWAAAALAAVALPLALVAGLSTGKRIAQYGYTPERLWAGVFVAVAAAAGMAYLLALVRGRAAWPERIRRANVRLAAGICLLAFFLALPILSFGALSARDQVARLRSGRIPPDKVDWAALRFDFGPAGRRALVRLAESGPAEVRKRAQEALAAKYRYDLLPDPAAMRPASLRLAVDGNAPVPDALRLAIARDGYCTGNECRLVFETPRRAILLGFTCAGCLPFVRLYVPAPSGGWGGSEPGGAPPPPAVAVPIAVRRDGKVELRTVEKKQVFLDGKPVGPVFDPGP